MTVEAISPALPHLLAWAEMDPEDRMSPVAQQAFRAGWEAAGRSAEPVPYEQVSHPQHYQQHPANIECIDVIEHMSHNVGAAIKYLWRHGLKGGEHSGIIDMRKAIWYIEREIARKEKHLGDLEGVPERSSIRSEQRRAGENDSNRQDQEARSSAERLSDSRLQHRSEARLSVHPSDGSGDVSGVLPHGEGCSSSRRDQDEQSNRESDLCDSVRECQPQASSRDGLRGREKPIRQADPTASPGDQNSIRLGAIDGESRARVQSSPHDDSADCQTNLLEVLTLIWRAGLKPGTDAVIDLEKAAWYATREAARLRGKP